MNEQWMSNEWAMNVPGECGGISVVGREAHPDHDPVGPRVDVATDFARGHIPWDEPDADGIHLVLRFSLDLNGPRTFSDVKGLILTLDT